MRHITDPYEAAIAFQRGEQRGFEYFFDELYPALLYYAFRIVRDKPVAEDVVSESFVKIWDNHYQFVKFHPKVIKSWLYTTVRHKCFNLLLQEQRKHKREEGYAIEKSLDFEQAVEENIIHAEVIAEIHKSLSVLPFACRRIFELMYIHGKTVRETAMALGLKISTVKNQKARGLSLIHKKCPDLSNLVYTGISLPGL